MKKLFAMMLALAMVFSLSVPVSAAPITGPGTGDVGEVKVNVIPGGSSTPTVYYVTLGWDSLTFTYTRGSTTNKWDAEKHNYSVIGGGGSWNKTSADITVTNHSNTDIGVAMNFDGGDTAKTVNSVTATLINHTFDLTTGEGRTFAEAASASATVTVKDAPSVNDEFTIGMVKITITDK